VYFAPHETLKPGYDPAQSPTDAALTSDCRKSVLDRLFVFCFFQTRRAKRIGSALFTRDAPIKVSQRDTLLA